MNPEEKKRIGGVRLYAVNYIMLTVTCVFYAILIFATVQVARKYDLLIFATENYIACERDAFLMNDGSDYLTEQVRLFAVTGEEQRVADYFEEVHVTRRRDIALEELGGYVAGEKTREYLQSALDYSNQLMEREIYAMRLVAEAMAYDLQSFPEEVQQTELTSEDCALSRDGKLEQAREMVFGEGYQREKSLIMGSISYFLDSIVEETKAAQASSREDLERIMVFQRVLLSGMLVLNGIMFALIVVLVVRPLRAYVREIQSEQKIDAIGAWELRYLANSYNDVSDVSAANRELLRYRAEHDPLTGIINRGGFEQLRRILKGQTRPLALLLVDVDEFKEVNDGFGHEMGDRVLKYVAEILRDSFRAEDYAARIGGDEFAVIVTDITPAFRHVISGKIENINRMLGEPKDGLPAASVSVGIAFSASGFSEDLFGRADGALYEVKKKGRCGYHFDGEEA